MIWSAKIAENCVFSLFSIQANVIMRKRLILISIVIVVLAVTVWLLVFRKAGMYQVWQGVPADAVFVAETPSFNSIHDKLYKNKIWTSLKEYPYFEAYHENLELADSLCQAYPVLRRLLTDRPFAVSCHLIPPAGYDFLYVCDLGKLNVVQTFDGLIGGLLKSGKMVKKGELTEVTMDDLKFYYTIKANLLWISFSEVLVQRGKEACSEKEAEKTGAASGDLVLDLNHQRLEKLLSTIFTDWGETSEFSFFEKTALALTMKDNALYFKGETSPDRLHFSLLSALNLLDGGKSQVKEIVSNHVAAYISLCYSSFPELENTLLENYKVDNLKAYNEYEQTVKRLNKFLGVDMADLLTSWIGNEIAAIKPAVDKEKNSDNLLLAIRSKDIDLAKDQLAYLTEQIGRKTPVRFKGMEYNGHVIHYLSLKGVFNIFLGSMFKKLDKPYFTYIGDYVVFSNSPAALASLIKDYSLGNTLAQNEKYNELMEQLGSSNNIYGYISSPETFEYLYGSLKPEDRGEFMKNKGAFQSFESVGLALVNAGSDYETRIIATHNSNAGEDYEVKVLNQELEELADRIEAGFYRVVVPDSIAVSTRGEYAYQTETLKYAGHLSNGDPEGIWNIRDNQNRQLAQCVYRKGVPDGETRFFYPDGVVLAQVDYEDGKIKLYKEFFQDGTLKMEMEYNRGVRHGEVRFYYSTGHLLGEGKYRKGRRTGTWKYYRVTGELERKMKF